MPSHPADDPAQDLAALRERYRIERERRSPTETARAYRDVADGFGHLLADPYGTATDRAPLTDTVEVAIVGGGFGGLLTAAQLREAGIDDIRIIEAGSDVGGAWYWNRYPGAACDVESYIYMPLLEETGYIPVERYSKAAEIRAHCQRIAEKYELYDRACLSTQVTALTWNAETALWTIETDRGDRMHARFVVLTTGPLNRPKLPDIPGIESFAGHHFHTSRWNYDYTGGSATTPLDGLADKRVGIIGTGATAIQCIPPLAASAGQLFVFQRTPSSVDARNNAPTDPAWVESLEPGWQKRRIESFTHQLAGNLAEPDLVADGWTVLARAVREKLVAGASISDAASLLEQADFEKMVQIRERIDAIVSDRATAEALKPWFSLFCKRPCFHDDYLGVFNRPNVTLVDTQGRGVEAVTPTGVVVGGVDYPLDCLIFATGFETATDYSKRSGFAIRGVGGVTLTEKWADGMSTLHGMHSRGFPNCFVIGHAQAGMSANFPHMIDEQARHIAYLVRYCRDDAVATIEPTEAAEQAWTDGIVTHGERRRKFLEACTPGYYNNEGQPSDAAARSAAYPAGPTAFIDLLRMWRDDGGLEGLERNGAHARQHEKTRA